MQKISRVSNEIVRPLPFAYCSTPIYLDFAAYTFERNGENLIVSQDLAYPHEFPSLFLPIQPKNWSCCSVTFATPQDVERVRAAGIPILIERLIGTEFYYKTQDFVAPTGSFRKKAQAFENKYRPRILPAYDPLAVDAFHERWRRQRGNRSFMFEDSEAYYHFCLSHLDAYPIKQVYVEVENRLVGFAWGIGHPNGGWVGLHLNVDFAYQGLSRFLHHERAKLFAEVPEFTLGTGCGEEGIEAYKRELRPFRETEYFYILTGGVESNDSR